MEEAIAAINFFILLSNLLIYQAHRQQTLNTINRHRKSVMASAVWPPSKNSARSGGWIRIPAKQTLRAMVEASLRPLEDENNCPISSSYLLSCTRSRFTQRLDPELDTLLDSLPPDEVDVLRTFAVDVDGLHHGLSDPTSKLVHGVSSWCPGRDKAIRNVALWYTDSIQDDIREIIGTFGQNREPQDLKEIFIRAQVEAYIAKHYASNIDFFLSQLEMDVAVIHLAHHVNCEMISKAMVCWLSFSCDS
ncbi:hypothetical protein BJY01DRAFT_213214 [Aspergillus pseudoustus]|uniref:Uncharacterized protein n=1 Tax=Aspergillus pseudoustus TaxID=1810923 RepID=A0ABR4K5S8_9EURO